MKVIGIQVQGDTGTTYTITPNPAGGAYCTCPAWKFGSGVIRSCKHIEHAFETLAGSTLATA